MGCVKSSSNANEDEQLVAGNRVRKPKSWTYEDPHPISSDELREMRTVFWRQTRFGKRLEGQLKVTYLPYAQAIIVENNLTLENPDMTALHDETGYSYELPLYVLSEPSNLRGNATTAGPSRLLSMMESLCRRI